MNTRLYVGNLSPAVSEADLLRLFSQAGVVTEVTLALDPGTHQSRGFGFVTMATPELAAAALGQFHGFDFGGRHITVTEARLPQVPKGLMSEGFDHGPSAPFRPPDSRGNNRRPKARDWHRRGGGR
jgi:RNA recognition motif-containing protein